MKMQNHCTKDALGQDFCLTESIEDIHFALNAAYMARALFRYEIVPPDVEVGDGWKLLTGAKLKKHTGLTDGDLRHPFKPELARMWMREDKGESHYVVCYESSRLSTKNNKIDNIQSISDFLSGYWQALGVSSSYFHQAVGVAQHMKNMGLKCTLVGHSLGGNLAATAAKATGLDAATFCAGGVHANTVLKPALPMAKVKSYFVPGEFVTLMQDDWHNHKYREQRTILSSKITPAWTVALEYNPLPKSFGERIALPLQPRADKPHENPLDPVARHGWVISGLELYLKLLIEREQDLGKNKQKSKDITPNATKAKPIGDLNKALNTKKKYTLLAHGV
jgi:hypothetical protein